MEETFYQVTYKTKEGLEVTHKRDTVERAYFLYKNLIDDFINNGDIYFSIKLEEISHNNSPALLRAKGDYKLIEVPCEDNKIESETEKIENNKENVSWFERVWGISKSEYNECISNWNRLTGDDVDFLE